jgi:CMP-N,N'-diacetyllegionaminic acid synthase
MKVLIPARSGSKGIPNKNLIDLNGRPLIFYTINEALKVFAPNSIFVSSDSDAILAYSKSLGVETIKRPQNISGDKSTSAQVINHFIKSLNIIDSCEILYLQPTSPLRRVKHIKDSIKIYKATECNSLISVCKSNEYIDKTFILNKNYLEPLVGSAEYKEIRQDISQTYYPNGAIYIFNSLNFQIDNKIPLTNVVPYIMSRVDSIDIDDSIDLEYSKTILKVR